MPKKRAPRRKRPDDDGYSDVMRDRLRSLKLQEEKAADEGRSVSETRVDDLIAKEADDAKINALNCMYYMDKFADEDIAAEENPDTRVLREKYAGALKKLDGPDAAAPEPARPVDTAPRKGFVELAGAQEAVDLDDLFASARRLPARRPQAETAGADHSAAETAGPVNGKEGVSSDGVVRPAVAESEESAEEEESIAGYLEEIQQRSKTQDKISRRVVKSPEERRQEYEASKLRINLATASLGVAGSTYAAVSLGVNEAFSFGLGSVGALLYLSGLEDYADNAESPVGTALGGRRLLVPVILVLLVTQWYKLEAQVPGVADLHLQPQLLPALIGFFMYSVGKVLGGLIPL